jgi:hypothetical protein
VPNLVTYQQKPPRLEALQWTGDPDDAEWIVEQYGGTMAYDAEFGELRFTFPGEEPALVPQGEWFASHPEAGVLRYSDEQWQAGWEQVAEQRR